MKAKDTMILWLAVSCGLMGLLNLWRIICLDPVYLACLSLGAFAMVLWGFILETSVRAERFGIVYEIGTGLLMGGVVAAVVVAPFFIPGANLKHYLPALHIWNAAGVVLLVVLQELLKNCKIKPWIKAKPQSEERGNGYFDALPRMIKSKNETVNR
jgi:hypothetical protein